MDGSAAKLRTVTLIGTSHTYQLPGNPAAGEFGDFVEEICDKFAVRAVAEEMSLEALTQKDASLSLCEQVANTRGIAHRYCDPNNEQRQALHTRQEGDIRFEAFYDEWDQDRLEREIRATHSRREQYWLNQLLDLDCWPVLFVCGAAHIEHFSGALRAYGLDVYVGAQDWPN